MTTLDRQTSMTVSQAEKAARFRTLHDRPAAMTGLLNAAREVKDRGLFDFLDQCATTAELTELMRI